MEPFYSDIFKCIFLKETFDILIRISLKFDSYGPINDMSVLVQVMAWHQNQKGDETSPETVVIKLNVVTPVAPFTNKD